MQEMRQGKVKRIWVNGSSEPQYENCLVVSKTGEMMFRCSQKKADWYLNRKLAERVSETPPTYQLLFESKGRGHAGDPYMLSPRRNVCVVCGGTNDLSKHHVVPYCYKPSLAATMKSHMSYDVLPVCAECHGNYEYYATLFKRSLAVECGVQESQQSSDWHKERTPEEVARGKALSAALALGRHKGKMPESRQKALEEQVMRVFGKPELSAEEIEVVKEEQRTGALLRQVTSKNVAEAVLEKIDDFDSFAIRWRKHFVETMQPKYLPEYWQVERRVYEERASMDRKDRRDGEVVPAEESPGSAGQDHG